MSAGEKVYHTGPCSDCSTEVDTRKNGDCYSGGPMHKLFGSVFLLCSNCQKKRPEGAGWLPGKKHDPVNIQTHE
jgi:hypothetical protein